MVGGSVADDSAASSPKSKVKFLCSHGGKVLPRPSDGLLKYIGGESRVISVPRTVTFSELNKKLGAMIEGGENMVLKYQLVPEDLETLVSVRNDEDLKHMIEEHDRHESGMLRAFLFPWRPVVLESEAPYVLEQQRYIDAINGILRSPSRRLRDLCSSYSSCSSPKSTSPDAHTAELVPEHSPFHARNPSMHRVRSSPSLNNLHSLSSSPLHHHDHPSTSHHHQHPTPPPHHHASPSPSRTPPHDLQQLGGGGFGMGRPPHIISLAKTDMTINSNSNSNRGTNNNNNNNTLNYYYSTSKAPKGFAYYDDSTAYGTVLVERVNSMPRSSRMSIWE